MKSESFYWRLESLWEGCFQNDAVLFKKTGTVGQALLLNKFYEFLPKKFQYLSSPDFTISENPIFEDEYGEKYFGLKEYSVFYRDEKPVFLVDNHHEVLPVFFVISQVLENLIDIVHIDAHRDDGIFKFPCHPLSKGEEVEIQMKLIANITSQCRVCDYLDAGKKLGIIHEVFQVTQSFEFENFSIPDSPFVLNLDIDMFGEEGSMVDLELKVKIIAEAWKNASAVCLATSPGFIDQKMARRIVEIMVR